LPLTHRACPYGQNTHAARLWKDRTLYDENRYMESLGRRSATPNTMQIQWKNVAGFSKPAHF